MSRLFDPLPCRGVTFKNRVFVSPMCQYSALDGVPNDWHLVHLGSRAIGGASLVLTEATGVSPEGRISPDDTGLWSDEQEQAWARVAAFVKSMGALAGVQLAHAGRKASTAAPWDGGGPLDADHGGWPTVAPSAIAFGALPPPRALDPGGIAKIVLDFASAARRAVRAGFEVIELHAAHGYLLHSFLSPLSNHRDDAWGGSPENRMRLPLDVTRAIRGAIPDAIPLFVRISASDWADGGWTLADSVVFARELKSAGADLVDCSSGGLVANAKPVVVPGYQVPFAATIRKQSLIATGAVGLITEPSHAEEIVSRGDADAVLLARAFLRDPYWALHAAKTLGVDVEWPKQYSRAKS